MFVLLYHALVFFCSSLVPQHCFRTKRCMPRRLIVIFKSCKRYTFCVCVRAVSYMCVCFCVLICEVLILIRCVFICSGRCRKKRRDCSFNEVPGMPFCVYVSFAAFNVFIVMYSRGSTLLLDPLPLLWLRRCSNRHSIVQRRPRTRAKSRALACMQKVMCSPTYILVHLGSHTCLRALGREYRDARSCGF